MKTTGIKTEEKKVTLKELQNILYKMDFYKRTWGFIAHDLSGDLTFFDVEPSFGGAYITREDILTYINEY
jgi:hypothetical protein